MNSDVTTGDGIGSGDDAGDDGEVVMYSYRYWESEAASAEDDFAPATMNEHEILSDEPAQERLRQCPDCGGRGSILLLTSTRLCEKCGGRGKLA
jgi:hypothetical protein